MSNDTTSTWSRHPGQSPDYCIECGLFPPIKPRRICGPCRSARVQADKKAGLARAGDQPCSVDGCDRPRAGTPSQRRATCQEHYLERQTRRRRSAGIQPRHTQPPGVPEGSKWCFACETIKPVTDYHRSADRSDGLQSRCKTCSYDAYLRRLAADPEKVRAASNRSQRKHARRRLYGVTNEEYAAGVLEQRGRCSICRLERKLVIDHDHQDGHLRGFICHRCNMALGLMADDVDRLRKAADYLEADLLMREIERVSEPSR